MDRRRGESKMIAHAGTVAGQTRRQAIAARLAGYMRPLLRGRAQPAMQGRRRGPQGAAWRPLYALWRRLPGWAQRRFIRATMPRVTMGVCAVVLDGRGRLLLVRHTYRRCPWSLPGGFVRGKEQPAATLRRELREELDVDAAVGPLLCAELARPGGHLTLYYRAELTGALRCDGAEIDAARYVDLSDAAQVLGTPPPSWLGHV